MARPSKKLAKLSNGDGISNGAARPPSPPNTPLPGPIIPTTTGLLSIPLELFHMIMSEFLDITLSEMMNYFQYLPGAFSDRTIVLRTLSQTCRALRAVCLPLAMERLEACTISGRGAWYQQVSRKLVRKSDGLVSTPELAKLVRIVTVSLTRCDLHVVLPAFARCLAVLPNLHTLQILHTNLQMKSELKGAFEGKRFPQIRTILLPTSAHQILRACPEVRHVTCFEGNGGSLVSAVRSSCKKVESFHGISPTKFLLGRLSKAAPDLKEIGFGGFIHELCDRPPTSLPTDSIPSLSVFPLLSTIVMRVGEDGPAATRLSTNNPELIAAACELLQNNSAAGSKKVVIEYLIPPIPHASMFIPLRFWTVSREQTIHL